MPCTATSGRSSPGIPGRYGRDARPRRTRPNQDSTRSAPIREIPFGPFVAPTLNRRLWFTHPGPEPSRVSSKTPLADHPKSLAAFRSRFFANRVRGKISLAAFRSRFFFFANRTNVCFSPRDRDALEIERASIGRDARRFRFRVRVTDGQRRRRTARALPHTSDDMSRSTSDDDDRNEITPPVSCVSCVSSLRLVSRTDNQVKNRQQHVAPRARASAAARRFLGSGGGGATATRRRRRASRTRARRAPSSSPRPRAAPSGASSSSSPPACR